MKPILVCLHGWGGSKDSFTELRSALAGTDLEILTPDLPGFGSEPEPDRPWSVDDYADWVEGWLRKKLPASLLRPVFAPSATTGKQGYGGQASFQLPANGMHLLGHSHGGRIAIKLAARQCQSPHSTSSPLRQGYDGQAGQASYERTSNLRIAHLYLCAAAGIRHGQYLKRTVGFVLAKTGKALLSLPLLANRYQPIAKKLFYRLLRVHDYEVAGPTMRQTMVRVTTENMLPLLSHITIPTDIFWGSLDATTPQADGTLIHEGIRNSSLHVYPGVRHGVHRDCAREIAAVIKRHLLLQR